MASEVEETLKRLVAHKVIFWISRPLQCCGSGSVSGFTIRIQKGRNDPQKKKKVYKFYIFEVPDVPF
jgi:hypothetical protein